MVVVFGRFPLEDNFQSKLELSWIESSGRLAERCNRRRSWPEGVVRHAEVRAVEKIKAFSQNIQTNTLGDTEATTEAHIKRSKVKASASIASYTPRSIIIVCVEVTITAQQNIEGQSGSVRKYVTQLKTVQGTNQTLFLALLRCLE